MNVSEIPLGMPPQLSEPGVLIILSIIAVVGMVANFANIYTTVKSPILHNAFGHLCASQSFAEVLNLLISCVWTVFVAVVDKKLATSVFGYKLGQTAFGVCLLVSYTVLLKAVNRFMAISHPFLVGNSKLIILGTWILGFLHFCTGFFEGCNFLLNVQEFYWYFDETPCGQILAFYIDLSYSCFLMAIAVLLDSFTLFHLLKFHKTVRVTKNVDSRTRKLDIRFFAQSCLTTLVQVLMLVSFHVFSKFDASPWAVFFTTTFAWAFCSAADGIVNFGFNFKYFKTRVVAGSGIVTTVPKSQIPSNHDRSGVVNASFTNFRPTV
uniref:7TM GPCR serpentine receptor class x (Srx) domain-containing protein n=1 Tax=Panagrolaimus sp. JU765 TaxID=591449 RepID=A0AC34QF54_9BILA